MMLRFSILLLFALLCSGRISAQDLDFLGIPNIHFGMKSEELKNKVVILDSTSSYNDTATYIRFTRCLVYVRPTENLQLNGFSAAQIEYEFCEGELVYVFVRVKGIENIEKAMVSLRKRFPKLNCGKKIPENTCLLYDTFAKNIRIIVRKFPDKQEMTFVLIPKQAAK
jgi:hypothetical protein